MRQKIEAYWYEFAKRQGLDLKVPDYWMFGDGSKALGDELAKLVLVGKKTGTCSLKIAYDLENEPIQQVGQYDIVLDGSKEPVAIIKYTAIEEIPMNEVTESFAKSEGEGDLTHAYWYSAHEAFFTEELKHYDLDFTPEMVLVCQTFEVCYM